MCHPAPRLSLSDFASLSDKGLCDLIKPVYEALQALPLGVTWETTVFLIREGMFDVGLDIENDIVVNRVIGLLADADA